jgi:hypothetical protein
MRGRGGVDTGVKLESRDNESLYVEAHIIPVHMRAAQQEDANNGVDNIAIRLIYRQPRASATILIGQMPRAAQPPTLLEVLGRTCSLSPGVAKAALVNRSGSMGEGLQTCMARGSEFWRAGYSDNNNKNFHTVMLGVVQSTVEVLVFQELPVSTIRLR